MPDDENIKKCSKRCHNVDKLISDLMDGKVTDEKEIANLEKTINQNLLDLKKKLKNIVKTEIPSKKLKTKCLEILNEIDDVIDLFED
jgi:transcriptional regulator NrdR family protein